MTRLLVELVARREVASIAITEHVGGAARRPDRGVVAALRHAGWA